jgi:hypothetical protein
MVKTIIHPFTGKSYKLGRKRGAMRRPRLLLRDYLGAALPPPPATIDYSPDAPAVLAQVLCNDRLGCCTASGTFHIDGLMLGAAGAPLTWNDDQVEAFYARSTGYVIGDPSTDNGGDEETVLSYWRDHGLLADGSRRIAGYLAVDAANINEIKTALWLFENVYFGVELPDAWINPMPSANGFTWDVAGAPDPNNGHCFVGVGYGLGGVSVDSWGMLGLQTWAAIEKYIANSYGGELWTVISQDALARATAKTPNGLDWAQLVADFDALGGRIAA